MSIEFLRDLQMDELIREPKRKPQRYNTTLGKDGIVKTPVTNPGARADSDLDTLIDDEWV